jgi:hypothetical protein
VPIHTHSGWTPNYGNHDGSPGICLHEIGDDQLMWGSDSPHIEGTWPHTAEKLTNTFQNVPKDEAAKVLGLTAASAYGFDIDKMNTLASEFGPNPGIIGI